MINEKSFVLEIKDDLNKTNRKDEFLDLYSSLLNQIQSKNNENRISGHYDLEGAISFRNRNKRSKIILTNSP
jgi:uncharacterized protein YktA (UPF0223 family)